jgi:hypothetical protein
MLLSCKSFLATWLDILPRSSIYAFSIHLLIEISFLAVVRSAFVPLHNDDLHPIKSIFRKETKSLNSFNRWILFSKVRYAVVGDDGGIKAIAFNNERNLSNFPWLRRPFRYPYK